MMRSIVILFSLFMIAGINQALAQEVVEGAKEEQSETTPSEPEKKDKKDESFGDYVKKVGQGIWGRLKERFNLDEASENFKRKGEQLLKRDSKSPKDKKDDKPKDNKNDKPKDNKNEKKATKPKPKKKKSDSSVQ